MTTVLCPRCGLNSYTPYGTTLPDDEAERNRMIDEAPPPALSRIDNETYICSPCGHDEAMRDFACVPPVPPGEWPIGREAA